jgi:hypothetical protein
VYHKFAVAVMSDSLEGLSEEARNAFAPTALAAAGKFCAGLVYSWKARNKYQQTHPEFVFEDGDLDKGTLMKTLKELNGTDPVFRPKKDNLAQDILAFTPPRIGHLGL